MATKIHVPDLGDYKDVLVAELLVKAGDTVSVDQPLVAIESDKATIEIPSPVAGRLLSLEVQLGDRISTSSLLAIVEEAGGAAGPEPKVSQHESACAKPAGGLVTERYDLVVIGAGPGGYSAAFRSADLGLRVLLVEKQSVLGGVCLNVGCIPSKALLHTAAVVEEAGRMASHGITFAAPNIDLEKLRASKDHAVKRLTDGLGQMARMRKVEVLTGTASFAGPDSLTVEEARGAKREIAFAKCIVAAGSSPIHLPFLPKDPRIVDSTGALELPFIPKRMLVIGGGIIGMEMATVYSALGARIDVVEQFDGLLAGADRDLVAIWQKRNTHRFDRLMLSTRLESVTATEGGLLATFAGAQHEPKNYDLILQAAGRRPNAESLNPAAAGLECEGGFICVDKQMRTSNERVFAIGDIVDQPMLAHKAVHQGHVVAEVIAGNKAGFDALVCPSVAYLDPEIAWVGMTEDAAKASGTTVEVGRFPWAASGRAIANGVDYGMTKLLFSRETGRIVGGGVVGAGAGDLIGEVCLAIEMGADAQDIGKTIHPHPTFTETIGMAAEVASGVCTDLPPPKPQKK
ncbi:MULTISPECIES: dihydrolipoyl dehydrogenase [Microvirga]|uniref:dihydrolipoyl dehydrogenase n=1 Tax=Microvirga TaxID=186650 RepID=UPI001B380910|nr:MULTISPECIES: dihydrolipoyl dehydrogenase [unclassified Microvirga]MBQ0819428.1 dihydrolipoyl dehydrogenase [Microvirga sp. HBU67558]